jgi:hypothetical protein
MATSSDKFGYASEVLMITLCGMIIASGVINMEQYQRVGKVKGDKPDDTQKNADYQSMANTWYGIDTAMGAVLGALILAMMTYQVGKGTPAGKGFASSQVLTYIFSFFAYAVIIMNSAYGLNVYNKTAAWKPKGECPGQPPLTSVRYKAMMAARARAMGEDPPKVEDANDAAKYASDVNKTNIAFISISSIFFAVFITYLGYNEAKKRNIVGGMRSQFLVY